jgi:hypothetical protein
LTRLDERSLAATPSEAKGTRPERASFGVLHDSTAGRLALGLVFLVLLASVVVWNLPAGEVATDARDRVRPLINVLGLSQTWSLFAPEPSSISIDVFADVTYVDGTTDRYEFPDGDPFVGTFREYRWRKLERNIRLDSNQQLWRPTAEWIAGEMGTPERPVAKVTLVRRFADTPPPGSDRERRWREFRFYTGKFGGGGAE